jgi:hypothetical protein
MKEDVTDDVKLVACERYKMVDDVTVDDVDSLHIKRITLNN